MFGARGNVQNALISYKFRCPLNHYENHIFT